MKKVLAILIFAIYGSTSFGMNLYFHSCCKDVAVEKTVSQHSCCEKVKDHSQENPCCSDKVIDFTINGDYDNAKVLNFSAFQFVCVNPFTEHQDFTSFLSGIDKTNKEFFIPPLLQKNRNHLYCVYTI